MADLETRCMCDSDEQEPREPTVVGVDMFGHKVEEQHCDNCKGLIEILNGNPSLV